MEARSRNRYGNQLHSGMILCQLASVDTDGECELYTPRLIVAQYSKQPWIARWINLFVTIQCKRTERNKQNIGKHEVDIHFCFQCNIWLRGLS